MELTGKQRAFLRGLSHHVDPVVFVGRDGPSEAVVRKAHLELEAHELIKARVGDGCELDIDTVATALAEGTGATVVQTIGHTCSLYRRRKKKATIVLPK